MNTQINVSGTPLTAGIKCSGLKSGAMGIAAMVAMAVSGASRVEGATIYHDGVSPALPGARVRPARWARSAMTPQRASSRSRSAPWQPARR